MTNSTVTDSSELQVTIQSDDGLETIGLRGGIERHEIDLDVSGHVEYAVRKEMDLGSPEPVLHDLEVVDG